MNQKEKEILLKRVGANIKALRVARKMEVKEFAARLKVTAQAIGEIEKGKVNLSASRLVEISRILQGSFLEIFAYGHNDNFSLEDCSVLNDIQRLNATVNNAEPRTKLKADLEKIVIHLIDILKSVA
jgi:transcriptional regulator with XRE-family HTH domain